MSVVFLLVACSKSSTQEAEQATPKADDPRCEIDALDCSKYSTGKKRGMALQKLVYEARVAGRYAEAICLASDLVDASDPWLSGASHFERSNAWEALGCHNHAIAEVNASLAVRPRGRSGWKETCDWCVQLKARCEPCGETENTANENAATATADGWWVPPSSYRPQSVEVVKFGSEFDTLDERDLGAVFTTDLRRVRGAQRLFEELPPKVVHVNKIEKHLLRSWDKSSISAGITFLFIGFGSKESTEQDLAIYHSRDVRDVIAMDEKARMRRSVDETAVFYLAEVRRGTSVDYIITGDYSETGKKLDLLLQTWAASLKDITARGTYNVDLKALGVIDATREGAWAMSMDEIRRSYRSEPTVIELVFRTIPGRVYRPQPSKVPKPVVDEPTIKIEGGDAVRYTLPPGHYKIASQSRKGRHILRWQAPASVRCDRPIGAAAAIKVSCDVTATTDLVLVNLRHPDLLFDDTIAASLYVGRLP